MLSTVVLAACVAMVHGGAFFPRGGGGNVGLTSGVRTGQGVGLGGGNTGVGYYGQGPVPVTRTSVVQTLPARGDGGGVYYGDNTRGVNTGGVTTGRYYGDDDDNGNNKFNYGLGSSTGFDGLRGGDSGSSRVWNNDYGRGNTGGYLDGTTGNSGGVLYGNTNKFARPGQSTGVFYAGSGTGTGTTGNAYYANNNVGTRGGSGSGSGVFGRGTNVGDDGGYYGKNAGFGSSGSATTLGRYEPGTVGGGVTTTTTTTRFGAPGSNARLDPLGKSGFDDSSDYGIIDGFDGRNYDDGRFTTVRRGYGDDNGLGSRQVRTFDNAGLGNRVVGTGSDTGLVNNVLSRGGNSVTRGAFRDDRAVVGTTGFTTGFNNNNQGLGLQGGGGVSYGYGDDNGLDNGVGYRNTGLLGDSGLAGRGQVFGSSGSSGSSGTFVSRGGVGGGQTAYGSDGSGLYGGTTGTSVGTHGAVGGLPYAQEGSAFLGNRVNLPGGRQQSTPSGLNFNNRGTVYGQTGGNGYNQKF